MPKSLADAKTKFTILTTKPTDPSKPTLTELAAGINAEGYVLSSDFTFTAAASDTVAEKELDVAGNAQSLGNANHTCEFTPFRYYAEGAATPDATADVLFAAVKERGTELWCYARKGDKAGKEAWASGEEIYMGAHIVTDTPQQVDLTGWIKVKIVGLIQEAWDYITVAPAA